MPKDRKVKQTLTDDQMVTSPKLTHRSLLAGAGIALSAGATAFGQSAAAGSREADKGGSDEGSHTGKDKPSERDSD